MSGLERRYRRLLALYPRDHRESTADEMLGVLLAAAGDRTRPGWRDTADLLWGALRLHLRRIVAADGGVDSRDVLAVVSLLGPVAMLAGAAAAVHEVAWWLKAGALFRMWWQAQIPGAPVWLIWIVVAVLAARRRRIAAAVGAWAAVLVQLALNVSSPYYIVEWHGMDAGWVLLGVLTAAALTFSPGPARGLALVRWRGFAVMACAVVASIALAVLAHGIRYVDPAALAVVGAGGLVACGRRSRVGRRVGLVLMLPFMAVVLRYVFGVSSFAVDIAVFYGLPMVLLLASGSLPRGRTVAR
ncbi:hypothetical protein [Actinophytocola oryzae]|uniref:Uncharacterized protein n=1 Tax=Actinophytocola oryzae TaxID=502181 RepID=A0A4V3FRU8_9PSEU|nr:hypothetical protein [Actinophytocola oryzae]TDV44961.1 hypothetical protein CLV71_113226 [Actinophytocola oryzae]